MKKLILTEQKNTYLKKIQQLINVKIMTYQEFLKEYIFNYDEQTIYYVMQKYNVIKKIAKIYLDNLIYVESKEYSDYKLNQLYAIKNDLINNNLLIFNPLFSNNLKKYEIILENKPYNSFWQNIISKLKTITKVSFMSEELNNNYTHEIYEASTAEEEVIFIFNKICELLKQNVDIKHIYLTNLNDTYRNLIKKYSFIYHIPVNLQENTTIYSTNIVQQFILHYQADIKKTLDIVRKQIKSVDAEDIYNKIINICNRYSWTDNYNLVKDMIIDDLKNTKQTIKKYQIAVNEIEFINNNLTNDDYLFVLGVNQNSFPKIKKDEDYLNDKQKQILGLFTSKEINQNNLVIYQKQLQNNKNLIISYKTTDENGPLFLSNIFTNLNYPIKKIDNDIYTNSHLYNELKLAIFLDDYNKYNIINPNLDLLLGKYPNNNYLKYDNSYHKINPINLNKYLKNHLTLSYSSLDNYNRCQFRYYLNNILKLNVFTDKFILDIGNIYHSVLKDIYQDDFNMDTSWHQALSLVNRKFTAKEMFFLEKLKKELIFIINEIKNQDEYSQLKSTLREEGINIPYENNNFKGYIDKIKYDEDSLAIIDYKTGNPNINLNNTIYGIGMQLPIYLYLVKHHPKFQNHHIAGFYLQNVLKNNGLLKPKEDLITNKKNNLKLQGYSINNVDILKKLDSTYSDSKMIQSLKQTNSKEFYSNSKVIDELTINNLINLVDKQIKEGFKNIMAAEFQINPKQIGKNCEGCKNCTYNDICFKSEKDTVELTEYKNLEFMNNQTN